ncbi:MAG: LCP family protein, partial [Ignavibacteria bacterium]|nr:LCP family protein [Ignavibacteria bacterium]
MKFKQILKPNNLANLVALIMTYVLFFITFFLSLRYIRLNLVLFLIAFGLIFIFILLFGIISLEGVIENNKKLRMIGLSVLTILSILLITVSVYVFRINSSINNIIVLPNQSSELSIAFVSYDSNEYQDSADMKEAKIGILSNSVESDRNSFVKEEIQSLGLNVSYIEFLSYNDLILSLFEKNIDIAALPNDYYNQFSDYEGYLEYLDKTKIVYEFKTTIENSNEQVDLDVTKEPFSILIMGNDGGRTDSLILATYNPLKLSVTMTSIPRDSYVPIACYPEQQKDKIGHAFSVSRDCAIQTVENLFDLDINYFVEVNFKGVVEIVDALDRIWIDSPVEFVGQNSDEERGHYTVKIFKGGQWVTGEQALAFARERYSMPGGDYQRQENQQQVIQAIIDRTLQLKDVNKAIDVLNAAGNNVKTNMSLNQMAEIFNVLINAINKTTLEASYMLDIMGSRVIGYSSYTYNEALQLPLWISKPYEGSIKDLKRLMLSNLEISDLPSTVVT